MMDLTPTEITTDVVYQIGAVAAFCARHGVRLHHVKPHGALGNLSYREAAVADAVLDAVRSVDPDLVVIALSAMLEQRAHEVGSR
jgi:UPF0271 protein